MGININYFIGLFFGDTPFFSREIYQSDVADFKTRGSVNISSLMLFEIDDVMRYELEIEFVPAMVTLGLDAYTTSSLQDNCLWMYYGYHFL